MLHDSQDQEQMDLLALASPEEEEDIPLERATHEDIVVFLNDTLEAKLTENGGSTFPWRACAKRLAYTLHLRSGVSGQPDRS